MMPCPLLGKTLERRETNEAEKSEANSILLTRQTEVCGEQLDLSFDANEPLETTDTLPK